MDERLRAMGYREFDSARYLDSPERIADYLNDMFADGEPGVVAYALKQAARARVMHGLHVTQVEPVEASLGEAFDTIRSALAALGMKLQVAAA